MAHRHMASKKPALKNAKRLEKYDLLCVAHPDDETIFFSGLLQSERKRPWTVVCMTNGNADGDGKRRRRQFEAACKRQGVKDAQWWGFEDIYEKRLPVDEISARLLALPTPERVFTHGIIGEYGHPHHQDVSYAVHQAFADHPKVYGAAYNAAPEIGIALNAKEFAIKGEILTDIYGSETTRFMNLLPATAFEGFLQLDAVEIEAVYDFFVREKPLRQRDLKAYRWLAAFLKTRRDQKRPF